MPDSMQEIIFECTHCKATLKAPETSAGKQGECPNCGENLKVSEISI